MQPSSVVVCSDLTVRASRIVRGWDIHVLSQESAAGGEAGDNSGEEVRSVFVPACGEGTVL